MIEQEEFPQDPDRDFLRRGEDLRHELLSMAITPAGFTVPRADNLLTGTEWEDNINGSIDEHLRPFALAGATGALYAFEVGASPDVYLDVLGKPVVEDPYRKKPDITDLRDHFDDDLGLVLCDKGASVVLLAQTATDLIAAVEPTMIMHTAENRSFLTTRYALSITPPESPDTFQNSQVIFPSIPTTQSITLQYTQERTPNGDLFTPSTITFVSPSGGSSQGGRIRAFTEVSVDMVTDPGRISVMGFNGLKKEGSVRNPVKTPGLNAAWTMASDIRRTLNNKPPS